MFHILGCVNTMYAKLFILDVVVLNLGMILVLSSETLSNMKLKVLFKKAKPACSINWGSRV